MRTIQRLIEILSTVNATAIDNDGGAPGEFLASVCHEAAGAMKEMLATLPSRPLDPDRAGDDEARTCRNMLLLTNALGGIMEGEAATAFLNRILNELVTNRGTK